MKHKGSYNEIKGLPTLVPYGLMDRTDTRVKPGLDGVEATVQHTSLSEAVRRPARKTGWCSRCKKGSHKKCTSTRYMKLERRYAPCECAASEHGHGKEE